MILDHITLLNKTILESLKENSEIKIIKNFTDAGVKILGADFGFVWLNPSAASEWKLVYKTARLPFDPKQPRADGRNARAVISGKIDYVKNLKNTSDALYVSKYMKSFVIIPVIYESHGYGTIVVCFKKPEIFPPEKKALSAFLGNGVAQAITIHRSRERNIKLRETEMLLDQEKSKTEFIANATHELRTPLAIMKGNVDLALMEKENAKGAFHALRSVGAEINSLSDILKDLALITSDEQNSGQIINPVRINLRDLIENLIRRIKIVAVEKKISIKMTSKKKKDLFIHGDEKYLEKLFLNLIKNSITYGTEGGKTLIDIRMNKKNITAEVSDNGIGISKEDLPKIFERFYQADKSHNGIGTGLGLAIAQWVARVHGGSISAKSTEGKGSTFTVQLPIK